MKFLTAQFRSLSTIVILAAAIGGGSAVAQGTQSDESVARAVETELRYSDIIPIADIQVSVEDGIVTLTGSVPSLTAFRQAEDIAATVRGVRSIVNRVEIEMVPVAAGDVRARAEAALAENPATESYQVDMTSYLDGVLTLEGTVDSWAERDLAETVAGSITGIQAIDNRIEVDMLSYRRGPGEIDAEISERLRWDARVDESLIAILVRDGARVTLSGTVGSLAEKQLATELAHVAGVRNVDATHLNVEPWANDEERRLGAAREIADSDIQGAIERALMLDPRVASRAIDVEVDNAEAVLSGDVMNMSALRAAERNARNTVGVRQVTNLLTVHAVTMSDAEIATSVEEALMNSGVLAETPLLITVSNGSARLVGNVNNAEQYWRADEIVANTRGVLSMNNELTIRGESPRFASQTFSVTPRVLIPLPRDNGERLTDRSLYEAVESELFWSPFVDEDEVDVAVNDGVVTLTGEVDSRSEYQAAAENAFEAGALVVQNELEIQ